MHFSKKDLCIDLVIEITNELTCTPSVMNDVWNDDVKEWTELDNLISL